MADSRPRPRLTIAEIFWLREGGLSGRLRSGGLRPVSGVISHIDTFGCNPEYVNLSLDKVGMLIVEDKND